VFLKIGKDRPLAITVLQGGRSRYLEIHGTSGKEWAINDQSFPFS